MRTFTRWCLLLLLLIDQNARVKRSCFADKGTSTDYASLLPAARSIQSMMVERDSVVRYETILGPLMNDVLASPMKWQFNMKAYGFQIFLQVYNSTTVQV